MTNIRFIPVVALAGIVAFLNASPVLAFQKETGKPAATAAQAAKVLDLSEFELIDLKGEPGMLVIAKQSYTAGGKLTDVAKRLRASFQKTGFQEMDGATFTDSYGSAYYQKGGFTISLSLSPGANPAETLVNINNHGNVDLKSLPVPKGAKEQYSLPNSIMYGSQLSVADAMKETKKLLLEKGWEPFGETTVSFFVKQNAVIVQAFISEAPAQDGKTVIQLSSEQISADIPAPPYTDTLQYSDATCGMLFDSDKSQAEIIEFFKERLAKLAKWEATTDTPIKISFREHLIFRNPAKEYLELDFQEVDGKTRTNLRYMTAKQFAEMDKKEREAIAKKQKQREEEMARENNPEKFEISLPPNSKLSESDKTSLELTTSSGKAKSAIAEWLKSYEKDGWKIEKSIDQKEVGEINLSKDAIELRVSYVDPGFIPGEITIRINKGYKLEVK